MMLQSYSNSCPTVNDSATLQRHSPQLASRFGVLEELVTPVPDELQPYLIKRKLEKHTYYTLPPEAFDLVLPTPFLPHTCDGIINGSRIRYEDVKDALKFANKSSEQSSDYQYGKLTFYKGIAFLNEELRDYARTFEQSPQSNPVILTPSPTLTEPTDLAIKKTVAISVQAIRQITGYSPVPWQAELLKDKHTFVFVVGSRQIGKSFSVAQLAIERSFIPGHRIMVASFVLNSTRFIRDYITDLTDKFGDVFTYYKKEEYILNTHTNSKIYFRTLSDEGKTVRGMKLDLAIIDEAAYVPNEIFERVIVPTISTTNGQIVSISSPDGRNWFFENVMKAKKGDNPAYSLYEIDITKNPFISETVRQEVYANKHKKRIRQEYFCEFGTSQDALFDPTLADFFPKINPASPNDYLVVGYDPARKADRAGVTFLHVKTSANGQDYPITCIQSLKIPDQDKSTYEKQAEFLKRTIAEFGFPQDRTVFVMDVTGVGDVVFPVIKKKFPVSLTILYTSGNNTESQPDRTAYPGSTHFKTSKSLLVSNLLDLHDENLLSIYEYTNQLLIEEITYLNRTQGKLGQIGFVSTFFDDIFNSLMLACYGVTKKGLLNKVYKESDESDTNESPFSNYPYHDHTKKRVKRSAIF